MHFLPQIGDKCGRALRVSGQHLRPLLTNLTHPNPLLPRPCACLPGPSYPHSHRCRACRSTLKSAESGRDLSLAPPLKRCSSQVRRPRRVTGVRACSMLKTRYWMGQDEYLPRPFNAPSIRMLPLSSSPAEKPIPALHMDAPGRLASPESSI